MFNSVELRAKRAPIFFQGIALLFAGAILLPLSAVTQSVRMHDEIVIGQNSFFDFGPPFNFYEVYVLRAKGDKTEVDRLSLTPPAGNCTELTTFSHHHATLNMSLTSLLRDKEPCTITDKQIIKEARRKRGLQFSGAVLEMRLACNGKQRRIPMQFLEEDLFSDRPKPPPGISWSMAVMEQLTSAFGNRVGDHPIFSISGTEEPDPADKAEGPMEEALKSGAFDDLFAGTPHVLSRMYAESLQPQRRSQIKLISSSITPTKAPLPTYPPIARAAHVAGTIHMQGVISGDGMLKEVGLVDGPKLLASTAPTAMAKWVFNPELGGQKVDVSIRFDLNCTTDLRSPDLPQ